MTRSIRKGRLQAVAFGLTAPLAVLVGGRYLAGVLPMRRYKPSRKADHEAESFDRPAEC